MTLAHSPPVGICFFCSSFCFALSGTTQRQLCKEVKEHHIPENNTIVVSYSHLLPILSTRKGLLCRPHPPNRCRADPHPSFHFCLLGLCPCLYTPLYVFVSVWCVSLPVSLSVSASVSLCTQLWPYSCTARLWMRTARLRPYWTLGSPHSSSCSSKHT